ncbi:hypothetical protein PG997_001434 [Apiospora hydei]|uniref:Uncharacterized protein n=1 Tax=Apiospora hydei TaxID=1337664 RepID=A0ABR1XDK4_9PEZI
MADRVGAAEGDLFQPLDYIPKLSGYLSREGYDEDNASRMQECSCQILRTYPSELPVQRWSAAKPQQVFLILREHLGDENLDLAGGVLYELIEIDCEYTDDPGAAFQRWRHDHMSRYQTDLELPHVPHMTTITPCIIPTEKLAHWRSQHPERYPFVLSDSGPPSAERFSGDRSCIRSRRAWLIDNTFYVSSKTGGTLPLNNPNPKEFHELQWKAQDTTGRLIKEREIPLNSNKRSEDIASRRASEARSTSTAQKDDTPAPRSSLLNRLAVRFSRKRKDHVQEEHRRSWLPSALVGEGSLSFKDWRAAHNTAPVPLPDGCGVPHAIFARKNLLVDEEENLPSFAAVSQMPVAETKATDAAIEAAAQSSHIGHEQLWRFRGPFTPQLGHSLDSQRPTTREARCKELEQGKGHKPRVASDSTTPHGVFPTMGVNRRVSHFGLDGVLEWLASSEHISEKPTPASTCSRLENIEAGPPAPHPVPPPPLSERPLNERLRLAVQVRVQPRSVIQTDSEDMRLIVKLSSDKSPSSLPLFENIAFVMSGNRSENHGPSSNRKATIIQLSPTLSSQYTSTSELHRSRRMCPVHKRSYLSFSSSTTRGESECGSDDNVGCYECAKEAEGELLAPRPPIVCELLHPRPRLCGVSQGVTAERLLDLEVP